MGRHGKAKCSAVRWQQRTLYWNSLCSRNALHLQSKKREWERNENTSNFWFTWQILSTRSQFVKKGKFLHLTNLISVLRLIPATRRSTVSILPSQLDSFHERIHLGEFYSCVWTTCLLLIKDARWHHFTSATCPLEPDIASSVQVTQSWWLK